MKRAKVTAVVDLEIRMSVRGQALRGDCTFRMTAPL
jgi:hypothetical protein